MTTKRYTKSDRQKALKMHREGSGYRTIARTFGCAESTVKKWVEQAGQPKHRKPNHAAQKKRAAIRWYTDNNVSMAAAAKKYGVHPKTMARWLSEAAVPSRDIRKFDKAKILVDIEAGMPGAQVARKHGCSESYVSALRNGRI
jgi:transposase-like protein